jgi:hypothetical protein
MPTLVKHIAHMPTLMKHIAHMPTLLKHIAHMPTLLKHVSSTGLAKECLHHMLIFFFFHGRMAKLDV